MRRRFTQEFVDRYNAKKHLPNTDKALCGRVETLPRNVRILGVDTSLRSTGIAIIDVEDNETSYVDCRNIPNAAKLSHSLCLKNIAEVLEEYIKKYRPEEVAIEGVFYSKNVKTTLILGEARGVVIAVCAKYDLPIYEYPPRRVKQAVTGTGTATKEQMQKMTASIFGLEELPQEDAGDALAIAMTHSQSRRGIFIPETI